jgi:hypothetical protein
MRSQILSMVAFAFLLFSAQAQAHLEIWQLVQRAKHDDFANPKLPPHDLWERVARFLSDDLFADIDWKPHAGALSVREELSIHNPRLLQRLVDARAIWILTQDAVLHPESEIALAWVQTTFARRPLVDINWRPKASEQLDNTSTVHEMLIRHYPQVFGKLASTRRLLADLRLKIKEAPRVWKSIVSEDELAGRCKTLPIDAVSYDEPISCRTLLAIYRPALHDSVFGQQRSKAPELWTLLSAVLVKKAAALSAESECQVVNERIISHPLELDFQPEGCQSLREILREFVPRSYEKLFLLPAALECSYLALGVVGEGYCGKVRKARVVETEDFVAVKRLEKKSFFDAPLPWPPREIALLQRLDHPNVVKLLHVCGDKDDSAIYLVTEFVGGGELRAYVRDGTFLTEPKCLKVMRQLVAAVDYMHRRGVVHRDLKLENILVATPDHIKIIDLGFGTFIGQKPRDWPGTAEYAAPEIWNRLPYLGPEVDIWSLGVILFEMAVGFLPFATPADTLNLEYAWPTKRTFSLSLLTLVAGIFKFRGVRLKMEQILAHPWITGCGTLPPIVRKGSDDL